MSSNMASDTNGPPLLGLPLEILVMIYDFLPAPRRFVYNVSWSGRVYRTVQFSAKPATELFLKSYSLYAGGCELDKCNGDFEAAQQNERSEMSACCDSGLRSSDYFARQQALDTIEQKMGCYDSHPGPHQPWPHSRSREWCKRAVYKYWERVKTVRSEHDILLQILLVSKYVYNTLNLHIARPAKHEVHFHSMLPDYKDTTVASWFQPFSKLPLSMMRYCTLQLYQPDSSRAPLVADEFNECVHMIQCMERLVFCEVHGEHQTPLVNETGFERLEGGQARGELYIPTMNVVATAIKKRMEVKKMGLPSNLKLVDFHLHGTMSTLRLEGIPDGTWGISDVESDKPVTFYDF